MGKKFQWHGYATKHTCYKLGPNFLNPEVGVVVELDVPSHEVFQAHSKPSEITLLPCKSQEKIKMNIPVEKKNQIMGSIS